MRAKKKLAIGSFASMFNGNDISPVFLCAALIYAILGMYFPSTLVWIFALLSLGSWFGCYTGYVSGGGEYFLGMNQPMRFVPFGLALIAVAFFLKWQCSSPFSE